MNQPDSKDFLPLTAVALHVLLTVSDSVHHGYAIKRAVEERTRGIVRLGAGTLYHALASLQKRRLVEECDPPDPDQAGSSRWRFYRITDLGGRVLRAEVRRLEEDVGFAHAHLQPREGQTQ